MRTSLGAAALPPVTDRAAFERELATIHAREKVLTRESDALAAARRRLPMVEVDPTLELIGAEGSATLLDAFEGRRQLLAYYFMWRAGASADDQCPGCTWCTTHVAELSYLNSRDITFAVFCQGPYDESARYRDFMGWTMPWYSALPSLERLLEGRTVGMMHIVDYVRDGGRVFETYWTTRRGVQVMDNSYPLMDLTVWGRQEPHEDSPPGWPQPWTCDDGAHILRSDGRPIAQWSRVRAGRDDDLAQGSDRPPEAT